MAVQDVIKEKMKVLENTTLKELTKQFGENSFYIGKKKIPQVPLICSSGSLALDEALGIGGWPAGRIIEIGGQESSGKSTLTLINIAECQRKGMLCAYIDAEQSFDSAWADKMGVDVENLLITQPDYCEEAFNQLRVILDSGVMGLIVVDSTNSMIPKRLFEGDVGDAGMGLAARIFSQELPIIRTKCTNTGTTVIFLSQVRSKIGGYGNPDVVGVGNAMKFYSSIRIKTSKAELEKSDEEGQENVDVNMVIFKNKIAVPFKKASFTLNTGKNDEYGIDTTKELIEYSIKYEFIKKAGSWYSYGDEKLGQGLQNVKKFFAENPAVFETVKNNIMLKLQEKREKEAGVTADSFKSKISEASEEIKPKRRGKKDEVVDLDLLVPLETGEIKDAEVVDEELKDYMNKVGETE